MPTRSDPLQQSYFFRPLLDHQSVSVSWIRIQTNLDSKALGSSWFLLYQIASQPPIRVRVRVRVRVSLSDRISASNSKTSSAMRWPSIRLGAIFFSFCATWGSVSTSCKISGHCQMPPLMSFWPLQHLSLLISGLQLWLSITQAGPRIRVSRVRVNRVKISKG